MKIQANCKVESSHPYIDGDGKVQYALIVLAAGEIIDSDELLCGDAERALQKIVALGHAVEVE